jgi:hypothetical protein
MDLAEDGAMDGAPTTMGSRPLGAGSRVVAMAGPLRRATLALRLAQAAADPVVLITARLDIVRAAIRAAPDLGRRAVLVSGMLESAELALRMREIATATPSLVALEPDRLWQARMVRALRAYAPRTMLVEVGGLAVDARERHLRAETVLRWTRDLFPDAVIVALQQPTPESILDRFATLLNAHPEQIGPVLPERVALRIQAHEDERARLGALLHALRSAAGAALVVAPSRGRARTLASALARAGLNAALYHGGQSAVERATILDGWRDGRQQLLVATEAIAVVPDLPCPALLAFSHPPRSLETLILLAERAEAGSAAMPVLVLHAPPDVEALPGAVAASVPALGHLRRRYASLRRHSQRCQVLIDSNWPDVPPTEVGAFTPTQVRLDLELLMQAGYLTRRADFARAASITPAGDDPAALAPLDAVIALRRGVPVPVDPLQIAAALGWQPHRLHQWLLDAEDRGLLTLRTIGREMLFTLRQSPADGAFALAALLDQLRREALADAAAVTTLLRAPSCRAQVVAEALGWPAPARCERCDWCAPAAPAPVATQARATLAVLHALAAVPRGMPYGAALRAARQALVSQSAPPGIDAADALTDLLTNALVTERPGTLGPVLVVTEAGSALLASGSAPGR